MEERGNEFFKKSVLMGEKAQQLRALIDHPEDLSSIPSNHTVAHSTICNCMLCPILICLRKATTETYTHIPMPTT